MPKLYENLADLIVHSADAYPDHDALTYKGSPLTYRALMDSVQAFSDSLRALGLRRHGRVGIYAGKHPQTVIAAFGASRFGAVFVPINPVFKADQVNYILQNCDVEVLVTSQARLTSLGKTVNDCKALRHIIVIDGVEPESGFVHQAQQIGWEELPGTDDASPQAAPAIGSDMAAIMYTSGSTGKPKGVVLSHTNVVMGAQSVAHYLRNVSDDRILAALPLSFDAGLSQVTTAFCAGATVVLHDYLFPRDVVRLVRDERVTGITGVPPLWIQLAEQDWSDNSGHGLRYFANTGGKMPRDTLSRLREIFPNAEPYLMYGLTESFRSTYLPPSEVDRRPDSIGKAVPNVEVMVVNDAGEECGPDEEGELVHRGPLVSMGYWNDPERTAKRFRPVPGTPSGLPLPELAVWSGDTVRKDNDGFLYFVGRRDEMIKTSGYRVSPTEIEEVAYASGMVTEAAALGVPHATLGQGILLVATAGNDSARPEPSDELLTVFRAQLPGYMVPLAIIWREEIPRNANGKLDRRQLVHLYEATFTGSGS